MSKLLASPKAQAKFMLKHALAVVKEMKLEQLTRDRVKESVMLAVDRILAAPVEDKTGEQQAIKYWTRVKKTYQRVMIAIQHAPSYSTCEKERHHFLNLEQLLSIPFVKWYSDQPDFDRYLISIDEDEVSLMAQTGNNRDWWVVCDIEGDRKEIESLNLPLFEEE